MTRAVYGGNVARGQKALTNRVLSGAEYGETAAHRGVASQHLETSPLNMRRAPPPTCEHHDYGCRRLVHTCSGVCRPFRSPNLEPRPRHRSPHSAPIKRKKRRSKSSRKRWATVTRRISGRAPSSGTITGCSTPLQSIGSGSGSCMGSDRNSDMRCRPSSLSFT